MLKLLFLSQDESVEANTDHIIFGSGISAFELEDLLINRDFKKALITINFMREHDRQNSAPIIWIIAKVINSCLESLKVVRGKIPFVELVSQIQGESLKSEIEQLPSFTEYGVFFSASIKIDLVIPGRIFSFFKSELVQFFILTRENNLDINSVQGSYAGAMGLRGQFYFLV